MSGQRIYSSGDDLGFLNGPTFLLVWPFNFPPLLFHRKMTFLEVFFQPGVTGMTSFWKVWYKILITTYSGLQGGCIKR